MITLKLKRFLQHAPTDFTGKVEWHDGTESYYVNGSYHREDGPAFYKEGIGKYYMLRNDIYTKEEWFEELTPEQKMIAVWNPENW